MSNSDQSVGRREGGGGGGGRRGGHTKERPMGVSTTPDCGFCTLSLLTAGQEFVRDFSSYFDCLSPGKYYITRLFDRSDAYSHSPVSWPAKKKPVLFWAWNRFHLTHVWWDSEICIRCCLCCCVVARSEQRSRWYPTLTWVSCVEGMRENNEKHTHTLIHTALIGSQKRWSESGRGRREGGESHHFLQKGKVSEQQKLKTTR